MLFWMVRKHYGKMLWLPAFSPFPKMFSKGLFFRVIKSWDCVVKDLKKFFELYSSVFLYMELLHLQLLPFLGGSCMAQCLTGNPGVLGLSRIGSFGFFSWECPWARHFRAPA